MAELFLLTLRKEIRTPKKLKWRAFLLFTSDYHPPV